MALLNLALDHLGVARTLLTRAGELEGAGRDEDDLAFLRVEEEFTNAQLMELDGGDFGRTIARQLLVAAYQLPLWQLLTASTDETLAGVAGKAVKEVAYHLDHARVLARPPGRRHRESRTTGRSAGLDEVWPYAHELFERDEVVERLVAAGVAADPAPRRAGLAAHRHRAVLAEATLAVPETTWRPDRGALRAAHHRVRLPARRDAAPAPRAPGGDVVSAALLAALRAAAAAVLDPELPVVTIADLGILRGVDVGRGRHGHRDDHPHLLRLPGDGRDRGRRPPCADRRRCRPGGGPQRALPRLDHRLDHRRGPAAAARARHRPARAAHRRPGARSPSALAGTGARPAACPQCGSTDTEELAHFSSTACKALWRCRACREPFDHLKAH